ncbi:MAG: DUF4340 domain-containing protein [Thiogranum sp.]
MTPSKQSLKWLSLLLFAQVGLAVGLNLEADRYNSGSASDTPLLALGTGRVDRLLIEDGDGHKTQLLRQGDHWVLPQAENFPATPGRVDALLASLAALKAGWPVASTSGAAERFKVAGDSFERRLTLRHGDKVLARLYVGTSPTYRKENVRVDGKDDVYSVVLERVNMPAEVDAWEDKSLLTLNPDDIKRVELPDVTLVRNGDALQIEKLGAGEQTATDESKALLQRIANLTYTASAGKPQQTGDDKARPVFEVSLALKSGDKRDYRFTQPAGAKDYLLEVSGQPWRFRVSSYTLGSIKSDSRSKLVTAPAAKPADAAKQSQVDQNASS